MGPDASPPPSRSSPQGIFRAGRACGICGAALLALVTFEGIAERYFNFEKTSDPVLGRVFRAGHTVVSRLEGNGRAHFIGNGVRRAAALTERDPRPVVALGDSYTEALQVNDDEVYTGALESLLRETGLPLPVLNVASSGYSAADYVDVAPEVRRRLKPAWTIVQIRDNDFSEEAWSPGRRHFIRDPGTGELTVAGPRDRVPAPWMDRLYNAVAIAPWTFQRLQSFAAGVRNAPPLFRAQSPSGAPPGIGEDSRADTQAYREALDLLGRAYEGRLTLLWIAEYDPRHPLRPPPTERSLLQEAEALGLRVVNTREAHGEFAGLRTAPFGFANTRFNYGHLNARGHAAAARLLAAEILRLHHDGLL